MKHTVFTKLLGLDKPKKEKRWQDDLPPLPTKFVGEKPKDFNEFANNLYKEIKNL